MKCSIGLFYTCLKEFFRMKRMRLTNWMLGITGMILRDFLADANKGQLKGLRFQMKMDWFGLGKKERDLHKACCLLRISGMKTERGVRDSVWMKLQQRNAERDTQNFKKRQAYGLPFCIVNRYSLISDSVSGQIYINHFFSMASKCT